MARHLLPTQVAKLLGAMLRSGDAELVAAAIARLEPVLSEYSGNLLQIAKASGIAHRTLCRWQTESPEFAKAVERARNHASVA